MFFGLITETVADQPKFIHPPFINKVNDLTISAFLIVAGLVKLVNWSFLWMRSTYFKPTESFHRAALTHNIAVQYYLGIDPQKRNDLFLLRNFENDKITNCFVVATNKKICASQI